MEKLVSKIIVINLKKSIDRKEHIINEFKKIGIENYDIYTTIDKDSDEVTNIMRKIIYILPYY